MIYIGALFIVGGMLFAAGITDLRSRTVSRGFLLALAVPCIMGLASRGVGGLTDAAGGFGIGLCAIGLSVMSREQIGRGDGIVIAWVGLLLGFQGCLVVVCVASLIMAFASIVILLLRRGNRSTRLAFLPALFAGYLIYLGGGLFGGIVFV
ncbi:MAG: prepilin peptidase [Roseburia sp.]|nr:prepilin peptidase [Roseburia sp.]